MCNDDVCCYSRLFLNTYCQNFWLPLELHSKFTLFGGTYESFHAMNQKHSVEQWHFLFDTKNVVVLFQCNGSWLEWTRSWWFPLPNRTRENIRSLTGHFINWHTKTWNPLWRSGGKSIRPLIMPQREMTVTITARHSVRFI